MTLFHFLSWLWSLGVLYVCFRIAWRKNLALMFPDEEILQEIVNCAGILAVNVDMKVGNFPEKKLKSPDDSNFTISLLYNYTSVHILEQN